MCPKGKHSDERLLLEKSKVCVERKTERMGRTKHEAEGGVKESSTIGVDRTGNGQVSGHLSKRAHEAEDHTTDQGVGDLGVARSCYRNRRAASQEEPCADSSSLLRAKKRLLDRKKIAVKMVAQKNNFASR